MSFDRFETLPRKRALSVFFTAGHPRRDDTLLILQALQRAGVDMVEVGMPFSDPVADGPTIQESSTAALAQGMTVALLLEQLETLRSSGVTYPVLLMGYLNPIEQFGRKEFFARAERCGIDGLIIPDMPFDEYLSEYKQLYARHGLKPVFLVTSRTSPERVHALDRENPAFLYLVSTDAITGGRAEVTEERQAFFKRIHDMGLNSPLVVGFGVTDRESFNTVTHHTNGAIIGSAFVRTLKRADSEQWRPETRAHDIETTISSFIQEIRYHDNNN